MYNFGDEGTRDLNDFKQFNLFIGKNGSGKTNVFRAICNLETFSSYSLKDNRYYYRLKSLRRTLKLGNIEQDPFENFSVKLVYNNSIGDEDYVVEFIAGRHRIGDFKWYAGSLIRRNDSDQILINKLHILESSNPWPAILSFSMSYIFQLEFSFQPGSVTEYFTRVKDLSDRGYGHEGAPVANYNEWSSGFFSITSLLLDFLTTQQNIVCIDEPEVHLEPRVLRKLLDILMWLSIRNIKHSAPDTIEFNQNMENEWKKWFSNSSWLTSTVWASEDPLNMLKNSQIFFASHSSVLINYFLKFPELCSIYEFDRNHVESSHIIKWFDGKEETKEHATAIASVRKVGYIPHSILDNLGTQGSDILQVNGVVWVEGPSDVIYIKKWLQLHAFENDLLELTPGYHYEFQIYGGAILDSICFMKLEDNGQEELQKLVSMFSFSRNAYIVIDSDAILMDGRIVEKSNFKKAKEFIRKQFEELKTKGYNLGLWYNKNNTTQTTIEDYIDDETKIFIKSKFKRNVWSKKVYAIKVTEYWGGNKLMSDFKPGLNEEISKLYDTIVSWNK